MIINNNGILKLSQPVVKKDKSLLDKFIRQIIYTKPFYLNDVRYYKFIDTSLIKLIRLNDFIDTDSSNLIKINDLEDLANFQAKLKFGDTVLSQDNIFPYKTITPFKGILVHDHKIKYNNNIGLSDIYISISQACNSFIEIRDDENYPYYINFILICSDNYKDWILLSILFNKGYYDFLDGCNFNEFKYQFNDIFNENVLLDNCRLRILRLKFKKEDLINKNLPIPIKFNDDVIKYWLNKPSISQDRFNKLKSKLELMTVKPKN
jgi:hypothetical protein